MGYFLGVSEAVRRDMVRRSEDLGYDSKVLGENKRCAKEGGYPR